MKKRLLALAAVLLLVLLPVGKAAAAETSGGSYVFDQCSLLSEAEREDLEASAETISETYDCGIYIAVVEDYQTYSTESVHEAAKAFFNQNGLGMGETGDGFLLMLSMDERDYWMLGHGDFGNYAFTDYGREDLQTYFLDNFREDDWYGGFTDYLTRCGELLELARNGTPLIEPEAAAPSPAYTIPTALVLGFLLALVISLLVRRSMRSVYAASEAGNYIPQDGITLRRKKDRFTHQTVTRTKIERNKNHSHTTIDSDGFSGSGGKF